MRKLPRIRQLLGGGQLVWDSLTIRQRFAVVGISFGTLVFAELCWRLMFEFLIGFLQMRDALVLAAGM